ncbi:MAG: hypothetical protein GY835_10105, partial [bacterium]|nr:hypothetical protein [bacterium]
MGEQPDGNPDFSETGAAPTGPLQYRPKRCTPFKVPLFDEAATLAVARAKAYALRADWQPGAAPPILEEIEKIYQWVYRPEMQFSLYDFAIDELDLLTTWDSSREEQETTASFLYDLYQHPAYDPLAPLGADGQMVFGMGYGEILVLLGEDQRAVFPSVNELQAMTASQQYVYLQKALDSLTPEDYLGLQLYHNSDAGNPLTEIMGLPLLLADSRPVKIMRQYYPGRFDSDIPGRVGAGYTDTYGRLSFTMVNEADVTVRFLNADAEARHELISKTRLGPGPFEFIVDYEDVAAAGLDGADASGFFIELEARSELDFVIQKVRWSASAVVRTQGRMLGQVRKHDVLIQDGSLG